MRYMYLTASALVVPSQVKGRPFWRTQALGRGSIVGVMKHNIPSYITGRTNEVTVQWRDVAGREQLGWMSARTGMKRSTVKHLHYVSTNDPLTAWDTLRMRIGNTEKWNAEKWIQKFASETNLPLLHAVIRELGGKVPQSDDPNTAAERCIRLITGKEIHMKGSKNGRTAAAEETTTAPAKRAKKAGAKKGGAKKAARKTGNGGPGRASAYAGKTIVRLVKENPRRTGTHGYNSWRKLQKGMTYEQYIAAGGRRVDLAWDEAKGNVKVVKR